MQENTPYIPLMGGAILKESDVFCSCVLLEFNGNRKVSGFKQVAQTVMPDFR